MSEKRRNTKHDKCDSHTTVPSQSTGKLVKKQLSPYPEPVLTGSASTSN